MKILALTFALLSVAGVFALAAFQPSLLRSAEADVLFVPAAAKTPRTAKGAEPAPPEPLPAIAYDGAPSFMQRFDAPLEEKAWYLADFVYRSETQRAGWSKDHIDLTGSEMVLKLTREPKEFQPYTGAEISRTNRYHYGRYEVVMRAARGSGLVSSFFTHTDEHQRPTDHHNEIDFEFLGYDTTMVQLNFYSKEGNMQGHLVDLPYDAADHYQLYTFEWMPDQIDWYVGDQHVLRATEASTGLRIPHLPSRLMMNLWSGSERQYDWHGRPTFESGSTSRYQCVSYQAPGDAGSPQCSDWFVADVPRLGIAG
ncbi:MAG: family 16 glycosylhydrolase [Pseudomonadota bacterium]